MPAPPLPCPPGAYGSAAGTSVSGRGGLASESVAVGGNGEGFFGRAFSLAFTVGGYGEQGATADTTATTSVTPKLAQSAGTAMFDGATYGDALVRLIDSAGVRNFVGQVPGRRLHADLPTSDSDVRGV